MIKYYDASHPRGVDVTPAGMAHKFHEALSTRGAGLDPSAPIKSFLFWNAVSIMDYLKESQ